MLLFLVGDAVPVTDGFLMSDNARYPNDYSYRRCLPLAAKKGDGKKR
jgi:hypothetical protein